MRKTPDEVRARAVAAARMADEGKTCREIAAELGYAAASGASRAIKRGRWSDAEWADVRRRSTEDVARARAYLSNRLDRTKGLRIICRSCDVCGSLKEIESFRQGQGRAIRWTCKECYLPRQMRSYHQRGVADPGARRSHFHWTGPEMELAARRDLTARQVGDMIGRSESAVQTMRGRLRSEPRLQQVLGASRRETSVAG